MVVNSRLIFFYEHLQFFVFLVVLLWVTLNVAVM